MPKNTW